MGGGSVEGGQKLGMGELRAGSEVNYDVNAVMGN